jgi:hypothetical protein
VRIDLEVGRRGAGGEGEPGCREVAAGIPLDGRRVAHRAVGGVRLLAQLVVGGVEGVEPDVAGEGVWRDGTAEHQPPGVGRCRPGASDGEPERRDRYGEAGERPPADG